MSFSVARRAVGAVVLAVTIPLVAGNAAGAKLTSAEKPILVEFLTDTFGRKPSTATVTCMVNNLPAGAISDMLLDAAFGGSVDALADSIPFRKVFRRLLMCKPTELVSSVAADFRGAGLTSKQATCAAGGFLARAGVDDEFLTFFIRSGIAGDDAEDMTDDQKVIVSRNLLAALRPCVPASKLDELLIELLLTF